jgi:hypothetical protein
MELEIIGMANETVIMMMATTIKSSRSEKPRSRLLRVAGIE